MNRDGRKPRVWIYYHVFHPSENVSARHFGDLAEGLAKRGWDVVARPAHRDYPNGAKTFALAESWNGVRIRRVWRPNWNQSRGFGRIANAAWMIVAWGGRAVVSLRHRPDVVLIGTDPILSVLAAVPWKLTRTKVAHWGFDIYPEAPIAEGMLRERSMLVRAIKCALRIAYRSCDAIVDIGQCMRRLLAAYGSHGQVATLTPWALVEPTKPVKPDQEVRRELFGDAALGVLYSGTFGRAHSYEDLLALARKLRGEPIAFCFAGRGNRAEQLKAAVNADDSNIRFAGFAAESELEKRLGAADIHLASLRPEWTGTVVPSKFFGSLAIGRPVIFSGSADAAIADWIRRFRVGWVVSSDTLSALADELRALARDSMKLQEMKVRCHSVYWNEFSKDHVIDGWNDLLRGLLTRRRSQG